MNRRSFLRGAASLLVAPAIVKVTNIMPVKVMVDIGAEAERLLAVVIREEMLRAQTELLIYGQTMIGAKVISLPVSNLGIMQFTVPETMRLTDVVIRSHQPLLNLALGRAKGAAADSLLSKLSEQAVSVFIPGSPLHIGPGQLVGVSSGQPTKHTTQKGQRRQQALRSMPGSITGRRSRVTTPEGPTETQVVAGPRDRGEGS